MRTAVQDDGSETCRGRKDDLPVAVVGSVLDQAAGDRRPTFVGRGLQRSRLGAEDTVSTIAVAERCNQDDALGWR